MSEEAIKRGKGIIANPEFFLTFTLALVVGSALAITTLFSWMDYDEQGNFEGIRLWAIGLVALIAIIAAVAKFTGLGQRLFVIMMSAGALFAGLLAIVVVTVLWFSPESGMAFTELPLSFDAGEITGYGNPAVAILLLLSMIGLAPAVIYGERILPLFVAFVSGVWGILSIIIFVMALLGITE